jgi:hypothetical protein
MMLLLMRGTFCATFGQSPLHDKVLQWGAHFGPHLVEVRCVTKSSDEGHILGHIWSKSAAWQSPPTMGIFWATFGWSPLRDKVLQWGAHFRPVLGLLANFKETRKVKWECQVEAKYYEFYLRSNGCDTRYGNWKLWGLKLGLEMKDHEVCY